MSVNESKCWYVSVLLIDAKNAVNPINHKEIFHDLKFICPIIATHIINFYATPSRLFIASGGEILSRGDNSRWPNNSGSYALGILPLIKFLLEFIILGVMNVKELAFADDFSVAGSLSSINDYWDKLTAIGQKCRKMLLP